MNRVHTLAPSVFEICFNTMLPCRSPKWSLRFAFQNMNLLSILHVTVPATWPAHIIFLYSITRMMSKEHKIRSEAHQCPYAAFCAASLCSFQCDDWRFTPKWNNRSSRYSDVLDDPGFIPGRARFCSLFSTASRPALGPTHTLIQCVPEALSPGVCGKGMKLPLTTI
jgi:hypothetical protein